MGIMCKLRGHKPDRGGARHDGEDYWTICKRCGTPLIRAIDGWREPSVDEKRAHARQAEARGKGDAAA
ncbi:DUF1660 family phage protein [Sphingomonas sanxanigenens]|uniref:Uncharacterized protein n=1 Tax=Sphingomonas sanxanigenens DSM 19645 = NX02 TaxID=1123269 RepID=W0A3S0_9SPHN|nr:DUF1660 family phage protein [Sphingomonas sanxanigenens]AHE52589.1 hypothetical protein NX02_04205 [Sphingomonas sanxanigenens DSM 19645 = NX02]